MLAFLRKTCGIIGKSPTKNPPGSSQETASINNVCSNFGYTNPPSKYSREVSCTAFWRSATCGPAFKMARETFGKPSWGAVCVIFRSEEHTSELQSRGHLVCRLLLEKKKTEMRNIRT